MARRPRFLIAALALAAACTHNAWAAWPEDRPIEVLVGFAAGGGTDVMVRNMLPFVQKYLGGKATLVVVNRPGAASEISNTYLARATPDGYTIGIVNVPALVFVPLYKKTQYEVDRISLVARVLSDPTVLVVAKASPYANLQQLQAAARKELGALSFGHNGIGTNGHLALLQLQRVDSLRYNAIPFNGTAQSKTALLGGHIGVAAMTTGELPDVENPASPFRVIAQLGKTRLRSLPGVPTAIEQGVDAVAPAERGFAAPKGLPPDIAQRLQTAVERTLKDPAYLARAANDAPVVAYLPGDAWSREIGGRLPGYRALAQSMPRE